MSDLACQLADELRRSLVEPARSLLGHDIADMLEERVRALADMWAAMLTGDDDHEAAGLVQDLCWAIWRQGDPDPE